MATVYTVGHSNVTVSEFIDLLLAQRIDMIVDVRSDPYSKYSPQFNRHSIEVELFNRGIHYIYLGDKLGGKPKSPGFLTITGDPDYELMSGTPAFKQALEEVEKLAVVRKLALMCSEADPKTCHRDRMLGWKLREAGHTVKHILQDGSILKEDQGALL